MSSKFLNPTHPGEMLLEEFLKPMGISPYKLAKDICVPQSRISKILKKERGITADTALRLAHYFGMTAEFWINLQAGYELKMARSQLGKAIIKSVQPFHQEAA